MTKEEIIRMYIEWTTGADETISQSDIICECYEAGFEYKEIAKLGDEKI